MTIGILGTKVGMTQIFDEFGFAIPVTVIKAGPCLVTQIKKDEKEGYNAIQVGYAESSPPKMTKPRLGHLTKSNLPALKHLKEYKVDSTDSFTVAQTVVDHGDPITATQFKGGAMYDLNDELSLFANFGIVEKPPIMDNVIYYDGTVATDPANEKFISTEAGLNYSGRKAAVKVSAYNTDWLDRNLVKSVETGQGSSGDTDLIFLKGVNQKHQGLEIETKLMPHEMVEIDLVASFGKWKFDGDADGTYQEQEYNDENQVIGVQTTDYLYALDGLFVGDMPQTSYIFGLTLKPVKGLRLQALYKTYDKNYSDWSPAAREVDEDGADRTQVWEAPGYSKLDLHMSYKLPQVKGLDMTLNGHIFNVLDEVFVQDAVDNSRYNSYGSKAHLAHNAEVFLGTPRYANNDTHSKVRAFKGFPLKPPPPRLIA